MDTIGHQTARRARTSAWAGALLSVVVVVSGCASQDDARADDPAKADSAKKSLSTPRPAAARSDTTGSDMTGSEMKGMDMGGSDKPSAPATMVCSKEIQGAVKRTFATSTLPAKSHTWSKSDRSYACTYRLPGGSLVLTVQDALNTKDGRDYFARLRGELTGAGRIRGVQSFGLPSLETTDGKVAFLKDGKTLTVDASGLTGSALPKDYTSAEAAYSVASAVVACWSE